VVIVKLEVIEQDTLHISPAIGGLSYQLTDLAIEAFNHAVGLRVARPSQAMLDLHASADFVKGVVAAGHLVFGGKAVSKLRAVIGQYSGDLDRRRELETAQEIDATAFSHVAVDVQENPALRTVDGDKRVAA
jgi:hypothetical protein